ncbi:MAG: amidohydrolase [candidate division WOR-3 bacterium]|nr:amidohydrolase [candidate division WOR-3 bacterium]MCX7837119.1 amidohydrolase [candidate division WOR-3 bacterium]MDW8113993.1 amidohydrolase [candidate division WOR-3 bacterium]
MEYLIKGKIYVDNNFQEGFLLVKNKKFVEIFLGKERPNYPIIDYKNCYLLPGFIDSHIHLLELGLLNIFPDLSSISSLNDLFDVIAETKRNLSFFPFLIFFNFDLEKIKEKRYPKRKELDKIVDKKTLIISQRDGHTTILNTYGLIKIFEKNVVSGMELDAYKEPTGVLRGEANELVHKYYKKNLPRDIKILAFQEAEKVAMKNGITTLCAMVGEEEDNSYEILLESLNSFKIDIIIFPQIKDINKVKNLGLKRIGGCILIDGSLSSYTAALSQPYEDNPNTRGILYFSDEELYNFLKKANDENLQTALHAIGDRAIEQVVNTYEKFLKDNSLRHRIEHCEVLNNQLIKKIKKLNLIISCQPAFEYYWGGENKLYEKRLGKRIKFTNPYRSLLNENIILVGGSDAPITPPNPLLGIYSALNHPNEKERINLKEAVNLFTKNAAYGIFLENKIGEIKKDYEADLVVLESLPIDNYDIKIKAVIKKGEIIWQGD